MVDNDYLVVSELKRHGEQVHIPDDAVNVTVQPLGQRGVTRVTYLTPLRELRFDGDSNRDDEPDRTYIY